MKITGVTIHDVDYGRDFHTFWNPVIVRIDTDEGAYLLRLEVGRDGFRNPRRSSPCLRPAADAGIAPAVYHADEAAGAVVMDFVAARPPQRFPGGEPALVRAPGDAGGVPRRHRARRAAGHPRGALRARHMHLVGFTAACG